VADACDHFAFAAGLTLELKGPEFARDHFRSEYGARAVQEPGEPSVVIEFGPAAGGREERHKSVHWRLELGDPAERPLSARIEVGGRPRRFVLSLLQGYIVEPLVAVAASRAGYLLLPAAAVETEGGAAVVLGRSRTGKSSLCAAAVAAGRRILGDDHILLDRDRRVRAFPRRLRVYPDLTESAPEAFRRLPRQARLALRLRAVVRAITRGYVSPPLWLRVEDLGGSFPLAPFPLTRVLAIRRNADASRLERRQLSLESAVELAQAAAEEQRVRLAGGPNADSWRKTLAAIKEADRAILEKALKDLPAEQARLPTAWGPRRSVTALAELLGFDAA